jgi:hypothetical protein
MAEATASRLSGPWHVEELVDSLERKLAGAGAPVPTAPRSDAMDAIEPPD